MKKLIMVLILIPGMITAKPVENQTESGISRVSYKEYMKTIREKLPEIKQNKIALARTKNKIYGAKSVDDITVEGSATTYRNNQYYGSENNGVLSGESYSTGLSKTFSATGTRLETGISYESARYRRGISTSDYTAYQPAVTVTVTQPLLYNFLGTVDKYDYKNAEMNYEIEKVRTQYNNNDLLVYYQKLYYNLIQYNEILGILENSINNATKELSQVRRKVRVGLSDNDDLQKAVSSVLTYKSTYKEYRVLVDTINRELALYFGTGIEPDMEELDKQYRISVIQEYKDKSYALTRSGKLYELAKSQLLYQQKVSDNETLPELNLFASYSRLNIADSSSGSLSELDDNDVTVGVEFKYTLGNRQKKSSRKDIELNIKELEQEKKAAENEYATNMQNIQENIKGYKQLVELKEANIKALNSQLRTETVKYRQARLNLSYLISTRNSIASERIEVLQYKNAIIQLYLDYNNITQ